MPSRFIRNVRDATPKPVSSKLTIEAEMLLWVLWTCEAERVAALSATNPHARA